MALTLWNLFETSLLCLNAFTIIHEQRLHKSGLDVKRSKTKLIQCDDDGDVKVQVYDLMYSLGAIGKFPVIFLNIITILLKLILGS